MDLFRDIETFSLANGVRCVAMPRAGYSIELHVFIATGSMHEGSLLGSGMSHFLEHMLFQGCAGHPGRTAPEKIQRYGGDINAYTTFERTVVTAHVAPARFAESMTILAQMVRSTEVAAARFDEERKVILRECNLYADKAQSRIFDAARELSFDRHPVRVPVIGYPELVEKLTRNDLLAYHAARYTPHRCAVVAVGNVDVRQFREAAENAFGDWHRAALAETSFAAIHPATGKTETIFFPDPQERLLWGTPTPGITDRRTPAADLLFGMLGGAESSFLPMRLELETPVAQSLRTFYHNIDDFGYAGISAAATKKDFPRLEDALRRELENFLKTGLTKQALQREKQRQSGDELAEMNDFSYLAGILGVSLLTTGRADFSDLYRRRLAATTLDEVRLAAELLSPEKFDRTHQCNPTSSTAPKRAVRAEKAPEFQTISGVRVVQVAKAASPMDYATIVLPGGALFESDAERGLSRLWSQLFLCGGGGIGEAEFLERLDTLGAAVNVNAGMNSLAIEINAPHKTFQKSLTLVGQVLHGAAFDARQFEREKARLCENIELFKSTPQGAAMLRARKLLFGEHPYAGLTNQAQLAPLTPEKAHAFWRNRFQKHRIAVGFSGAVDVQKALPNLLGGVAWQRGKIFTSKEAQFPLSNHRERIELEREQLAVVRILPGVRLGEERPGKIFSLLMQSENGLFSRLFQEVREKESLVYSVGMRLDGGFHRGAFAFYGLTRPDQGKKLAELLDQEVQRLATDGIDRQEFELAVERQTFENGALAEHPDAELSNFALNLYYGRAPETPQSENDFLRQLKRREFNREVRAAFLGAPKLEVFAGAKK